MRRLMMVVVAVCALWACPVASAQDAATRFVAITQSFEKARASADERAETAAQQRRAAMQRCSSVWTGAPARVRGELFEIWFVSVGGGFYNVDGPLFERWANRLSADTAINHVPSLAASARELKRIVATSAKFYKLFDRPCAIVTKWRDRGWSKAARPTALAKSERLLAGIEESGDQDDAARAYLKAQAGKTGTHAFNVYRAGVDEPDERIEAKCDPIGHALSPGDVKRC